MNRTDRDRAPPGGGPDLLAAVIAYWLLAYALDREEASKLLTLLIVIAAAVISLAACCRPRQPGEAFSADQRKPQWLGTVGILLLFAIVLWETFADSAMIWHANPGPDLWRGVGRGLSTGCSTHRSGDIARTDGAGFACRNFVFGIFWVGWRW
jgi:hypothetical protein